MSVRLRILIPMVMISILAASTILFFNDMQFSAFVDNYIEEELERAVLKVTDEIRELKMKSHTAVLYYANDNALIKAMEREDREAARKRVGELFAETDVESLTVVDTDMVVLARGHHPDEYGDDASGIPVVHAALAGAIDQGTARGISTSISVRATSPIYNSSGRLLGALFAGSRLDTEQFVDRLKAFTGCEISVIVDDVRVATTQFDEYGMRATDAVLPGSTEEALLAGDAVTRQTGFQGRVMMVRHTSVIDSEGEIVGIISIGKYLTEKQEMMRSFVATGALITAVFIAFSILIILFVSRQIAAPIDRSISLANYDKLTGVFSRRFLEERLDLLLKTLSRSDGVVSLLMIDIDFFKRYNDAYGHVKGDDCLKAVAAILAQAVAGADGFVARYGGEEFVVVLPGMDEGGARGMAEKLLADIRQCGIPHEASGAADHVTISIGVTSGRVDQTLSGTDIIRQADSMLYTSKRGGRDRYTFAPIR